MNYTNEHSGRSRPPTVPPFSNRTLHHPSFLPLYMAADFGYHQMHYNDQTVQPIIPAEFFYTDRSIGCGMRIPNIITELRVLDCFELNTPRPVMSPCLAPPTRPDPFRSAPHPAKNLGSLALEISTGQPKRVILQLTQEEDQAVTNLLKLHYLEPLQSDETLTPQRVNFNPSQLPSHPQPVDSVSHKEGHKLFCRDVQHQREASQLQPGRCWSDSELEVANTLLSCFSLMEDEKIWGQSLCESVATLPGPAFASFPALPTYGDLEFVTGERHADVHLPVSEEPFASSPHVRLSSPSSGSEAKSRVCGSGDCPEVEERMLSESEGDAVLVLLSLGDMGALDIEQ